VDRTWVRVGTAREKGENLVDRRIGYLLTEKLKVGEGKSNNRSTAVEKKTAAKRRNSPQGKEDGESWASRIEEGDDPGNRGGLEGKKLWWSK